MTIKAITFDFWATLYKPKTVDYNKRLLLLKETVEVHSESIFELEQFKNAVKVARETWSKTWLEEYRTLPASEWLEILLQNLPASLSASNFWEIQTVLENSVLEDPPTLVPHANTVLPNLANGYKLAIISDTGLTPGRILRQILEKDRLIDYFSHLTFSDEVGRSKPHTQAFLTTLKKLDVAPQEAVHIGDLLRTDIAGAKQVGMRAIQYVGVNYDKETSTADTSPDAIIENLVELETWLQQWAIE